MVYMWKPGARYSLDPQEAGERLEKLRSEHGTLTATLVVDEARNPLSPLHEGFEWDDTRAAVAHRLDQARNLMRSVVIVMQPTDDMSKQVLTRAFVVVNQGDGDAYTSTAVAMADADMRAQVLARAIRELTAWQDKYKELQALAEVFEVIDRSVR